MVPLYPYSGLNFWSYMDSELVFLNSARSALLMIAKQYKNAIFLIPSYTCPTVIFALEQENVKYNFVDVDDMLDFNINDLNTMIKAYKNHQIILMPTSLFGIKIRDYKKLYPQYIIIEDRAQTTINTKSMADFQIVSFGKGKMVSGFSGGAIYDKYKVLHDKLKLLSVDNNFLKNYLMSIAQKLISRAWFLIENTKYDPEKSLHLDIPVIIPSLMSVITTRWILNTLHNANYTHRIKISNYYLKNIKKQYLFNISQDNPYLRMPIKKNILFTGVSKIEDFNEVYYKAKNKRTKKQQGAIKLVNGSFLPTHDLVTLKYAKKLVNFINNSH